MPTNGVCGSAIGEPTDFTVPVFDQPPIAIDVGTETYLLAQYVSEQLQRLETALATAQTVIEQHEHAIRILCDCPCAQP